MNVLRNDPGAVTPGSTPVVLYDGVCGLCDRFVQFVLRHDARGYFRFAPLQGAFATAALARHGVAPGSGALRSMVLLEAPATPQERVRLRSDAVLAILTRLGGAWRMTVILRVVPRPLRDAIYDLVARVRYRVFGKHDACALPPASAPAGRFLD